MGLSRFIGFSLEPKAGYIFSTKIQFEVFFEN